MDFIAAVRKRPAMYIGDTQDGGVLNMLLEVVANSFDQHLAGACSKIDVRVEADGTLAVADDGPGVPIDSLVASLTRRSETPTVDGHRPHVHFGLGAIGLHVVNILSDRFELVTVRDGVEARVVCSRGELVESLSTRPTGEANGTRVRFRPDPQVFSQVWLSRADLSRRLEDLAFLAPRLTLSWSIAGDALAAGGLAALVALRTPCVLAAVAHHRGSYGDIDVEVAFAWGTQGGDARIDSFVNLVRTVGDGAHVDGLRDALSGREEGLVAAVAVILADVKYGNPTKDRLDSPEARPAVAEATLAALAAWTETQ